MAHTVRQINGMTQCNDRDLGHFYREFLIQGGVIDIPQYTNPYKIDPQGVPDKTCLVNPGVGYVPNDPTTPEIYYTTDLDSSVNTSHSDTLSNPRIDAVVLAVDISSTPDAEATNIASIEVVEGTEAGSPSAPTDGDITTALVGKKWIRLADVDIAFPFVSITVSDITDQRDFGYLNGKKIAIENDEWLMAVDSSGNVVDLMGISSIDNIGFKLPAANKAYSFQDVNGVSYFEIDDNNNRVLVRRGWDLQIDDSASANSVYARHDSVNGQLGCDGDLYLQPTGNDIMGYNSNINARDGRLLRAYKAGNVDFTYIGYSTGGYITTNTGELVLSSNNGNGGPTIQELSSDPSGANGMLYYNTTSHKFRGYANGSWVDLH